MAKKPTPKKTQSEYLRTEDEISGLVDQLRDITTRPITVQPDIEGFERQLNEKIDAMLPGAVDAGTGHIFDELIDHKLEEWIAAGYEAHAATLVELRILAAKLDAHLAGHTQIARADEMRVRDTGHAHDAVLSRIADDDLPQSNPLRTQRDPSGGAR